MYNGDHGKCDEQGTAGNYNFPTRGKSEASRCRAAIERFSALVGEGGPAEEKALTSIARWLCILLYEAATQYVPV
ncbi:hypothetical protein EM20IM_07025 [Candidatus Methylacidiphilum infernorum]|uniref:Uncharacterized protein n=1 Tax=Candidatus Methylacidiphilum infernorum TaxID=511746 RepID=A0ABX7PUA8_9BACT|nr:hypothetical protein [Candidatus Methylacidiphilum infernorum]QSR86251.1 hypothetical protein EM20IM_07025 [Candidatus Methylacidiphilum infernorum]